MALALWKRKEGTGRFFSETAEERDAENPLTEAPKLAR
jgi:hypothetical protein